MENIRKKTLNRTQIYTKVLCLLMFLLFFFNGLKAEAASLSFAPAAGAYTVDKVFSVAVNVASVDQVMNALSAVISFPQDKLEITALSKTGSIVGLWVQEPSFSNDSGTINLEGVILNPGFTGSAGKIITLNFKAKNAGAAELVFASASVLANDGKGTNILKDLTKASFRLNLAATGTEAGEATTFSNSAGTPLAPRIISTTHSDPEKWYADKNPKFEWNTPQDITAVRVLYNKYPSSQPTVIYENRLAVKELKDIADGIWYFHAQFRNANGWGAVSHFRFQIDTIPPDPFVITFPHPEKKYDPRPVVLFNTTDTLSGIDYYIADIYNNNNNNNNNGLRVGSAEITLSNPYVLPPQSPGKKNIVVKAFDKAGNSTVATSEFTVAALAAPTITEYPKKISEKDLIKVRGQTYPYATVDIFIKQEGSDEILKESAKSNARGEFILVWTRYLGAGKYKLWATITDSEGGKSENSTPFEIMIEQPTLFRIGSIVVNYFSLTIVIIALLLGIIAFVWYGFYRIVALKNRLHKEITIVEKRVHQAFDMLREEMRNQVKFLEQAKSKRSLTNEEEKVLHNLKKNLDKVEQMVEKEIEDIEKKV